jgi:hypothetical protein
VVFARVRASHWAPTATLFERDMWLASSDRTLRPDASGVLEQRVQSVHRVPSEGVTALFVHGVINRALGWPW